MNNRHVDVTNGNRILARVHEGMHVYNTHDETIGRVEAVYLGTANADDLKYGDGPATADAPDMPGDAFAQIVADVFGAEELPPEMAERLRYSGFARVNVVGFFGADRFVTPDQIDRVSEGGIHLKLPEVPRIAD